MVVPPTLPPGHRAAQRRAARAQRSAFVAGLQAGARARLEAALATRLRQQLPRDAQLAAYHPIGSEIAPPAFLPPAALPWFEHAAAPMRLRCGPPLAPGPHGIPQPAAEAPEIAPTHLLVPLLVADPRGFRLGQGGGHYDRWLAALPRRGAVCAIGLAWDVQIAQHLAEEPWDMPLDAIATPSRWIAMR